MDELEISGKRYISAKRIAKENKYHSDYIGQLIRGGKIAGTKVGRAWYVEEDSFARYLRGGETMYAAQTPVVPVEPAQKLPSEKSSGLLPPVGQTFPQEHSASAFQSAPVVMATSDVVQSGGVSSAAGGGDSSGGAVTISPVVFPVIPSAAHIPIRHISVPLEIEPVPVAAKKPSLTYVADSSPLFPEIQKRTQTVAAAPLPQVQQEVPALTEYVEAARPARSILKTSLGVGALGVASAVFFIAAFFGSIGFNSTLVVEKGKSASVSLSQESTFCFIFKTCQKD